MLWKYSTSCSHIWRAPFLQDRTNAGGRGCIREEEPELCEYPFRTARQSCPCGLACVMGLGIQPDHLLLSSHAGAGDEAYRSGPDAYSVVQKVRSITSISCQCVLFQNNLFCEKLKQMHRLNDDHSQLTTAKDEKTNDREIRKTE
ncbi:hypothetical protein PO909_017381 [Leuciscus waleckii]